MVSLPSDIARLILSYTVQLEQRELARVVYPCFLEMKSQLRSHPVLSATDNARETLRAMTYNNQQVRVLLCERHPALFEAGVYFLERLMRAHVS